MMTTFLSPVFAGLNGAVAAFFLVAMTTGAVGGQDNDDPSPLFRVAPEHCVLYSTWSNQSKPDRNSKNHLDRLLAEPEVAAFTEDLAKRFEKAVTKSLELVGKDRQQPVAEISPAFTEALFKKSGCLFVEKLTVSDLETTPEFEGVLLVEMGDEAGNVAKVLSEVFSRGEVAPSSDQIGGQSFYSVIREGQSETAIYLGSANGYLIAGIGREAIERALSRMAGNTTPTWLSELQSRHNSPRRNSLGFINIDAIRKAVLPLGGPEAENIVAALGLANVQSLESSSGYSETEMVNRFMLRLDGEPSGLLALFGEQGIQPGELQHIPADSLFAAAMSLDPSKVMDFVQSMMQQFAPGEAENMDQFMTEFKRETGVDLQNHVLRQLGSTWCLYNGASDGWLSGLTLTVSVDEPQKLAVVLKKLIGTVKAKSEGARNPPQFTQRTVGNSEVHTFQIQGMPLPIEPSWCIAGNRLIVTLFPQTITPLVRPMEYPALVDAEMLQGLERPFSGGDGQSKMLSFGYQNSQRQFEIMYPYAQMLIGMSRMLGSGMSGMPPETEAVLDSILGGIQLPPARSIHQHLVPMVSVARQTTAGFESETRQTIPTVDGTIAVPIAVGMLLPAVQQVRMAARRTQSANNLRQMALASLNYESTYQEFPAGFAPMKEGQPPVSWRVRILPYIEQGRLYEQYNFDEPWDSENNLRLMEMMPEIYQSPNSMAGPGLTVYRGIGGPGGLMGTDKDGASSGRSLRAITDGTSNTIIFIETSDELAVPWTKPDEGLDPQQLNLEELFGMYPGGTNAVFSDGSVRFLADDIDAETLQMLMIMNDGKLIPFDELDR